MQNNFKWWYALLGLVAYIISFMLGTWMSNASHGWVGNSTFNLGAIFNIIMFIAGGIICLLILRLVSKKQLTRLEFGLNLNHIGKIIRVGCGIGVLFFGFTELVEAYSKNLSAASEQVVQDLGLGKSFANDILLLLNVGLFAPVVEEIIFRGAIFNPIFQSLKKINGIPKWAALITGLLVSTFLFVFSHGGGGQEAQLVLLGILGVLAGLAMYLTNNLFAAILVHAVNNVLAFNYMVYKHIGFESTHGVTLIFLSIFCLILCIPLGLLFAKILPRLKN